MNFFYHKSFLSKRKLVEENFNCPIWLLCIINVLSYILSKQKTITIT